MARSQHADMHVEDAATLLMIKRNVMPSLHRVCLPSPSANSNTSTSPDLNMHTTQPEGTKVENPQYVEHAPIKIMKGFPHLISLYGRDLFVSHFTFFAADARYTS